MDANIPVVVDLEMTARLDVDGVGFRFRDADGQPIALILPRATARQIAYFLLQAADRLEGRIPPRCPFPWAVRRS